MAHCSCLQSSSGGGGASTLSSTRGAAVGRLPPHFLAKAPLSAPAQLTPPPARCRLLRVLRPAAAPRLPLPVAAAAAACPRAPSGDCTDAGTAAPTPRGSVRTRAGARRSGPAAGTARQQDAQRAADAFFTSPYLPDPTWGPVAVETTPDLGRGLVTTLPIKAGDLLLVSRAIAVAFADDLDGEDADEREEQPRPGHGQGGGGRSADQEEEGDASLDDRLFEELQSQLLARRGFTLREVTWLEGLCDLSASAMQQLPVPNVASLDDTDKVLRLPSPLMAGERLADVLQANALSFASEDLDLVLAPRPAQLAGDGQRSTAGKAAASPATQRDPYPEWEIGPRGPVLGLWPEAAMLNHSCVPNTTAAVIGDRLVLRSSRDGISEESPLTLSYLPERLLFAPLAKRREWLSANYGFTCSCPRCTVEEALPAAGKEILDNAYAALHEDGGWLEELDATLDGAALDGSDDGEDDGEGYGSRGDRGRGGGSGGGDVRDVTQRLETLRDLALMQGEMVNAMMEKVALKGQRPAWLQGAVLDLYHFVWVVQHHLGFDDVQLLDQMVSVAGLVAPGCLTHVELTLNNASALEIKLEELSSGSSSAGGDRDALAQAAAVAESKAYRALATRFGPLSQSMYRSIKERRIMWELAQAEEDYDEEGEDGGSGTD